jgi:hypothetical protein
MNPMSCTVFLDLLAREAPPVEFEAPLVEARAAGAPPEVLAELDRAKLAALRVRALLEHRARRGRCARGHRAACPQAAPRGHLVHDLA